MNKNKKIIGFILVLFIMILIAAYGKIHIIYGSKIETMILPKESFSLSETFVNFDVLCQMPLFVAKIKYPLTIMKLQEEGFLETENEREARIHREIQSEEEKVQERNEKWKHQFDNPDR
jgi:hypothetical protein